MEKFRNMLLGMLQGIRNRLESGSRESPPKRLPPSPFERRFDLLRDKVRALPAAQCVPYAVDCARQVLHKYEQWSRQENEGSPQALRDALELVESHLGGNPVTHQQWDAAFEQVSTHIPHTEDSPTVSPSGALDAGLSVLAVLRCARDASAEEAYEAGQAAIVAYDISSEVGMPLPPSGYLTAADLADRDLSPEGLAEWNRQMSLLDELMAADSYKNPPAGG